MVHCPSFGSFVPHLVHLFFPLYYHRDLETLLSAEELSFVYSLSAKTKLLRQKECANKIVQNLIWDYFFLFFGKLFKN